MKNDLWNMFANIKNGLVLNKLYILQPKKKMYKELLDILWDEGFILGYTVSKKTPNFYKIYLKYRQNKPTIKSLQIVTKPGHRVFYSIKQIWKMESSKSIIIFSTNKGFMTLNECKKIKQGGELFIVVK